MSETVGRSPREPHGRRHGGGSYSWLVPAALFAATLLTTTAAGAHLAGLAPLRLDLGAAAPFGLPVGLAIDGSALAAGLLFSGPLLLILFAHEMGHLVAGRRHGLDVSYPYFIPVPHVLSIIGTFGAFIRIRSLIPDRRVLMDVGAAGPVASFVLSVPVLAVGLALSPALGAPAAEGRYAIAFAGHLFWVGSSPLVEVVAVLVGAQPPLLLHPIAFAGWIGLFVTILNLFPLGQLDGGHVLYALDPRLQRVLSVFFLVSLVALGMLWVGWWVWIVAVLLLGRGTIAHPPVWDPTPVDRRRRLVGFACILVFLVSFVPTPFRI